MRFVPANDYWYQLPKFSSPDAIEQNFLHNQGEFSIYKLEAFEKHLRHYSKMVKFFSHYNGTRLKRILREENFWYGRDGLYDLINNDRKDRI